jgi:cysteine desulfurase family protein
MYYLDNAATSWPKPPMVYNQLDDSFRHLMSPKRGTNAASRSGGDSLHAAREVLAKLFNITNPSNIAFTPGATYSLNLAIQAYPFNAGDGVVMSAVEHHALSRPIRKMARDKGIEFFVVPYTDETPFDLAAYETLLKTKPNIKLVATTHASNVIGSILPVAEIGRLAHQYGKHYLLDAAQSAGLLTVDVQALNVDMLAVPGHKSLYGPPGVGALYVTDGVQLNTFIEGGTGNDSGQHAMHMTLPSGVETGTIPLPLIQGLAAGTNWVQAEGLASIHNHEQALLKELIDGLNAVNGLTIYGHQRITDKTPVVSFNLDGWHCKALGEKLYEDYGIALRAGYHCAPMAHEAIGTLPAENPESGGTLRASIGAFTKLEDLQMLIEGLTNISIA